MDTQFAPAGRLTDAQVRECVEAISRNGVIDGLLHSVSGLLAVLNEQRQILTVNQAYLDALGLSGADSVLGLRPGESLQCQYAHDMPGGCGTSAHCPSCGAAIAIVTSVADNKPAERTCALRAQHDGLARDLYLRVRACPVDYEGRRLVLLFVQDITREQQQAVLQRAFFHDINNIVMGLVASSELMVGADDAEKAADAQEISRLSLRLSKEVAIQQALCQNGKAAYPLTVETVAVSDLFEEITSLVAKHPASAGKTLQTRERVPGATVATDVSLLIRILANMVVNALEASDAGDEVRLWADETGDEILFGVWNRQAMAPAVAARVFQRNFSTKGDMGRGIGTYSMKLLGEEFLHGHVDFTTSPDEGTCFQFRCAR
jgi:signal transduction histidine kinase